MATGTIPASTLAAICAVRETYTRGKHRILCLRMVLLTSLLLVLLTGCTTLEAPPPTTVATPTTQRILLVRGPLPATVAYTVRGPITVRKANMGEITWALEQLAQEARTAGANAVMNVKTGFAPSWFGWATPHGTGVAVRITAPSVEEAAGMSEYPVEWR